MAKETMPPPLKPSEHKAKLPKLPANSRISKRPLLHPAIASKLTSATTQKIVYVSPSSPFIASIKRVRTFLSATDKRQNPQAYTFPPHKSQHRDNRIGKSSEKEKEEVLIKGTGKAIEKVLQLALYFQGQSDVRVVLRTGSVGAVDDVLVGEGADAEEESRVRRVSCLEVGVSLR